MMSLTRFQYFAKNLLFFEIFFLIAGIYFFWFPSNFPAPFGATGIERPEWLWLLGLMIPVLVLRAAYIPDWPEVFSQRWIFVGAAILSYSVLYVGVFSAPFGISTNIDRADYIVPILACIPLFMLLRFIAYGRLWTHSWLDVWFIAFIILCMINVDYAPHPSRGYHMLARPLLGMGWVIYMVELRRTTGKMDALLWLMLGLALLIGMLAISDTQWTNKSNLFRGVIVRLPDIDFFFAVGGLNPNEIGGALAWLVPFVGGLFFYRSHVVWRGITGFIFLLLLLSLLLGQSRSAIMGVIIALIIILLLVVRGRAKYITIGLLIGLVVLQAIILFVFLPLQRGEGIGVSIRDARTVDHRFAIWDAAFEMTRDHPLTGIGMNSFRYVRDQYPIEKYQSLIAPHAHNEFIQIMTDLGLPGLLVFTGWHITLSYMLWLCWRTAKERMLTIAITGGLLAHGVYGMMDALPLWDRFSFLYWMMVGLAVAQYIGLKLDAGQNVNVGEIEIVKNM